MGTYIVGGILLALFILVIVFMYRRKKQGKGCYGGCKNCASSAFCHPEPDKKDKA